eukprot:TRINITY_DN73979_c0_g1_i1.p1 TRINITY_DN73979_c0_g1~~TRINITY_DN73979_c0_g1_i1.p1  ORF type:complete len:570 (+),score=80.30 TRINITY_DN73979_c0_g1_i1:44-1753(+)
MQQLWQITGGIDKGGIIVRAGKALSSPVLLSRLSAGAWVEEVELVDNRLHYRLLRGDGPVEGWLTVAIAGTILARRAEESFDGTWEDDAGTKILIKHATMRGLGIDVLFEAHGFGMCSFSSTAESFTGRLIGDGRLVWSDGAVWQRKFADCDAIRSSASPTLEEPSQDASVLEPSEQSSRMPALQGSSHMVDAEGYAPPSFEALVDTSVLLLGNQTSDTLLPEGVKHTINEDGHEFPASEAHNGATFLGTSEQQSKSSTPEGASHTKDAARQGLPVRGADGRRALPSWQLSKTEIVEWIADAVDEFETMLLPLEQVSENIARLQYKQILLLVHPDKNRERGATDAFRKLFDALAVIIDPVTQKRVLSSAQQRKHGSDSRSTGFTHEPSHSTFGRSRFDIFDDELAKEVFAQANVDDAERVLNYHSERLEQLGKYDARPQTWINPQEAKHISEMNETIFVDVRDRDEFELSHIAGACHILPGFAVWAAHMLRLKSMKRQKTKLIIVYSDNGSVVSRCAKMGKILSHFLGGDRVRRLRKGLNGWKRLGFPVKGDPHPFLPSIALVTLFQGW